MSERIRNRNEIPAEDTWNTLDMFASDEAWEQQLATISEDQKTLEATAQRVEEDKRIQAAAMQSEKKGNGKEGA